MAFQSTGTTSGSSTAVAREEFERGQGHYLDRLNCDSFAFDLTGVVAGFVILTSALLWAAARPTPHVNEAPSTALVYATSVPIDLGERESADR